MDTLIKGLVLDPWTWIAVVLFVSIGAPYVIQCISSIVETIGEIFGSIYDSFRSPRKKRSYDHIGPIDKWWDRED